MNDLDDKKKKEPEVTLKEIQDRQKKRHRREWEALAADWNRGGETRKKIIEEFKKGK